MNRYFIPRSIVAAILLTTMTAVAMADETHTPLFNRENLDGWNTLVIRAEGNRQRIWLNDHQVADVRDDTSDRGRIGFQIHAGDQFEEMRVIIKQVDIREL